MSKNRTQGRGLPSRGLPLVPRTRRRLGAGIHLVVDLPCFFRSRCPIFVPQRDLINGRIPTDGSSLLTRLRGMDCLHDASAAPI